MATKIKFTSPFGAAQYPHLSKPDTQGKFADNKFKTKLVCSTSDTDALAFIAFLDGAAIELHGKAGAKLYKPYVRDDEAGTVTFIFKSKYAPGLFDAACNQAKGVNVGNGSVLRVMGVVVEFEKGVSAQIVQVQIKELNAAGICGFDAVEDGYVFDASDVAFEDVAPSSNDTDSEDTNASALDI